MRDDSTVTHQQCRRWFPLSNLSLDRVLQEILELEKVNELENIVFIPVRYLNIGWQRINGELETEWH
jgi:hypothetical protein